MQETLPPISSLDTTPMQLGVAATSAPSCKARLQKLLNDNGKTEQFETSAIMLLLRTELDDPSKGKLELIEAFGRDIPDYAILSHTWGDDEVLYAHILDGTAHRHEAYGKVISAMRQAASDGLAYVWIDSCCIDKSSSAELSEALNSMYAWYQRAEVCYAYLEDVPERRSGDFEARFAGSRWFTRAFLRLQEEIIKRSDDQSIFAWTERSDVLTIERRDSVSITMKLYRSTTQLLGLAMPTVISPEHPQHGLLADSPSLFAHSRNFVPCRIFRKKQTTFQISNRGLGITLPLLNYGSGFIASLECRDESRSDNKFLGIYVAKTGRAPNQYARVRCDVLMEDRPVPGPSSWRELFFRQTADKGLETAPTRYILLRHTPCQEDGYALTRIVHFKVLPDERPAGREVYSNEESKVYSEADPSQSTILRLRSAQGRLLERHIMTVSLVRQLDRKRLLVIIGVDKDLALTFVVNPSAFETTDIMELSPAQFKSNIGSSCLAATTEDGDHIAAAVRKIVERHRHTTVVDLHTWRGEAVCANHTVFHLPMADEKCISSWTS